MRLIFGTPYKGIDPQTHEKQRVKMQIIYKFLTAKNYCFPLAIITDN